MSLCTAVSFEVDATSVDGLVWINYPVYVVECCVFTDGVVLPLSQKYAVVCNDHVYVLFLLLCEEVIFFPPSAKTECECLGSKVS